MRSIQEDNKCPRCKATIDASESISQEKAQPSEGDISVCLYCAAILVFQKDLTMRECTREELNSLRIEDSNLYNLLKTLQSRVILLGVKPK